MKRLPNSMLLTFEWHWTKRTFEENRIYESKPFIRSTEELKVGIVGYVKDNLPEFLVGQVWKALNDKRDTPFSGHHRILRSLPANWTFLGCPKIMLLVMPFLISQWRIPYDTLVARYPSLWWFKLQYHWKEIGWLLQVVSQTIKMANTNYIPLCAGLSGDLGSLQVDDNHIVNMEGLPIDVLILDVMTDEESDPLIITTTIDN